jgi:hypothetical protein
MTPSSPTATPRTSQSRRRCSRWYRRRALRVFRDDTSLSATPHLWPTIEQALGESRFLILLASPEAAASQWVNKEVDWWLAHRRRRAAHRSHWRAGAAAFGPVRFHLLAVSTWPT